MIFRPLTILAFLAGSLSLPGAAGAATVSSVEDVPGTPFSTYLGGETYRRAQASAVARQDAALGRLCEEGYVINMIAMVILEPVVMDEGDAIPTSGRWLERYNATRCGTETLFNSIVGVNEAGNIQIDPAGPGETRQSLSMVRDLLPVLLPRADLPECQQRVLVDTSLGVPDGHTKKVADGEYETWAVEGCGKVVDMVLVFSKAADGNTNIETEAQYPR